MSHLLTWLHGGRFTSDAMPLPGASIWKAVAEVLTKGLSTLHPTVQIAVLIGAVLGIFFEVMNQRTHGKFPISGVGLGLAFVLKFTDSFAKFGNLDDNQFDFVNAGFMEESYENTITKQSSMNEDLTDVPF